MAHTCEGCGEQTTRWSYAADGPWTGRLICRECRRRGVRLKRLSWAVTLRFKIAQVLPPNDPMTVPVLRLLMAVDDVRRAQMQLVEADQRLHTVPPPERYRALGDWLYFIRLLFSHLHEAGSAVRRLDTNAKKRVDAALAGNQEALAALKAVRNFFNAADYDKSLIARVRNTIGSHYDDGEITALVAAAVADDTLLESTVAEVGGLARMADPLVRAIMNSLNGGDFMIEEEHTLQVAKALDLTAHFITFVDHLVNALMRQHPDAVVEQDEALIEIPPLVQQVKEAVDAARRSIAAQEGADGGSE